MSVLGYYGNGTTAYDATGWVTADRPCRRCGGNLRGQHLGRRCPACGEPVGASVYGDLLAYADPGWLATVRTGLRIVWWTTLMTAVIAVLLWAVLMVVGMSAVSRQIASGAATRPGAQPPTALAFLADVGGWFQVAVGVVALTVQFVVVRGVWLATAADPRRPAPDPDAPLRKRTRTLFAVTAAKAVIDQTVGVGVGFATASYTLAERQVLAVHPLMIASGLVTEVLMVGSTIALAYYLSALAVRAADVRLAGRARAAGWGLSVSFVVVAALGLLIVAVTGQLNPSAGGPPGGNSVPPVSVMAAGCASALVGLAALGFGVWYWVGIGQTANRVGAARAYAEAIWSQPFGPAAASVVAPSAVVAPPVLPASRPE